MQLKVITDYSRILDNAKAFERELMMANCGIVRRTRVMTPPSMSDDQ